MMNGTLFDVIGAERLRSTTRSADLESIRVGEGF